MKCYHGDILTVNVKDEVCSWLVEDGGKIVFVGNELPERYRGAELVELVLAHYEQLSERYRRMIPLKMVYIPVTGEGEGNRRISPP